jgi:valyl-tRNA synthetase
MPFISEELWQCFRGEGDPSSIMIAPWPSDDGFRDPEAVRIVTMLTHLVTSIRRVRADFKVPPTTLVDMTLALADDVDSPMRQTMALQATRLARLRTLTTVSAIAPERGAVLFTFEGGKGAVRLGDSIDVEQQRRRIEQELEQQLRPLLRQCEARLQDAAFVAKAPAEVHAREVDRKTRLLEEIERQESYLKGLA